MKSQSSFTQVLSDKNLKVTKARLGVLEALRSNTNPATVDDIARGLGKCQINADQVTLYRILDIFCKSGLVTRLEFGEGKFRYELKKSEHHHLICERCGSIEDVTNCPIDELTQSISKKHQFMVKRHALEFFGLCQSCQ